MLIRVKHLRAVIVAMLAACLMLSPAHAGTKSWQISESSGEVSVESENGIRAASRGQALKAGDAVKTGASGRAVIVRGGEYVIVSPKSRVRITKPSESGGITQIFQSVGSALFKIEKKETPHFGVKTPYLAAVVKGTTFNVTVTDGGATVQVTEGRVEVSTLDGGASDMIVPGRIGRVDAQDRQLLKVLGTDEKSIRSPLPAPNIDPAASETAPAASRGASPSSEEKVEQSGSTGTNLDFSDASNGNANSGFSGRIGSAISSQPVSIALATGGLISGGQIIDRVSGRNGSATAAGNSSNGAPSGGSGDNAGTDAGVTSNGNASGNPADKSSAPDDKGTPPADKGGAADDKGAPPADKGGAPDDNGAPPADKGGAPDDKGGPPADKGGPPDDKGGPPADKGAPPADKGAPPADKGGAPDDKGSPPADKGGAPDDKGAPPADKGGAPDDKGSPPADKGGAPDDKGAPPADKGGAPDDKGAPPADKGGVPDDKGAPPADKGGAPADKGGPPADKGGAPSDKGAPPADRGGGKPPRS